MTKNGTNSKRKFVADFLEGFCDFSKGFVQSFSRESWHYKNLRIGGYAPDKIYRNLNNLRNRGILQGNKNGEFKFTKKGLEWADSSIRRYFRFKQIKWDKKWRVVIFDIPQELHLTRIKFGKKLKNLGFFTLQKSVFVFPYPCEEELGVICEEMKISDYVDVIVAENPGFREDELKKHYNL